MQNTDFKWISDLLSPDTPLTPQQIQRINNHPCSRQILMEAKRILEKQRSERALLLKKAGRRRNLGRSRGAEREV